MTLAVQAMYLLDEALREAPGDRRLQMVTSMVGDLKRLVHDQKQQQSSGQPWLTCLLS